MEPENNPDAQPRSSQEEDSEKKSRYEFFSVNNETNSLVMLKKIPYVLPLLVVYPVFIILNLLGV